MEDKPLKEKLSPCVPLRFPGFERQFQYEKKEKNVTVAYNFESVDCRDWYRKFAGRVIDAVDKGQYLPLYRMGDGEYIFALEGDPKEEGSLLSLSLRRISRRILGNIRNEAQRGSGGVYTSNERKALKDKFTRGVKMVSKKGILALGLHESPFYSKYINPILNWIDDKNIRISRSNYIHFYSTYALINGPDSEKLLKGRRVLVATGFDDERKKKIRKGLEERGVEEVNFLSLSERKSMIDSVNVETIDDSIELVLIAAGIGAVNILNQLREVRVPQIDIGFCMNIIANPELRWERPFCVPDPEFDKNKIKY